MGEANSLAERLHLPELNTAATLPDGDPAITARLAEAAGLRRMRQHQIENSIFSSSVTRDLIFIGSKTSDTFIDKFNTHKREEALNELATDLAQSPFRLIGAVDSAYMRLAATARTPEAQQRWFVWRNHTLQSLAPVFFEREEWNDTVNKLNQIRAVTSVVATNLQTISV